MGARDRAIALKRELEWRKCAKDEAYFLRSYYRIQHPARGAILFDLREPQEEALEHWREHRYSLTLKARQIGWSTLVAAHCLWLSVFHSDQNIIMLSRTERESISLLRKAKYGWARLPDWMQERAPRQLVDHSQKMIFSNGSQIVSMPSASDPARGESASLVVVDEWAFLPNPEDAWASIEPVADIGGRIIGLSTANGSGNFFHKLWVEAETGVNQFATMFYPWSAVGERDEAWYAAKKRSMPSWQLHQEYPSNPEEAFIRSGRVVFDVDALSELVPQEAPRGHLHPLGESRKSCVFDRDDDPDSREPLTVWIEPEVGEAYVIGADVAEGLEHGDFSSAHVIKVSTGDVVAHWHGHTDPDVFGEEELAKLGWWYNTALIVPEANNHGVSTINGLRRAGYPRIYRRRTQNTTTRRVGVQYGFATNKATKPPLIDDLAAMLRTESLGLACHRTIAELKTYVRDEKGGMHGSPHDDRVISLALAVVGIPLVYQPEYRIAQESDYNTFEWWARGGYAEQGPKPDAWRIGQHSVRR